jgi:hypothetical protein
MGPTRRVDDLKNAAAPLPGAFGLWWSVAEVHAFRAQLTKSADATKAAGITPAAFVASREVHLN